MMAIDKKKIANSIYERVKAEGPGEKCVARPGIKAVAHEMIKALKEGDVDSLANTLESFVEIAKNDSGNVINIGS